MFWCDPFRVGLHRWFRMCLFFGLCPHCSPLFYSCQGGRLWGWVSWNHEKENIPLLFPFLGKGLDPTFISYLHHRNPTVMVHTYFHRIRKEEFKVSFTLEPIHWGNSYLKNTFERSIQGFRVSSLCMQNTYGLFFAFFFYSIEFSTLHLSAHRY